jgi:predicted nucleic acid-binding protein
MIRVAIDSNILIYAEIEPDSAKGVRSADLILRTARDGVIPAQALGEFLRFVQRRFPASFEDAIRQALLYQSVFITPPTTDAIINKASELARAHRMQLWDCVVCAASAEAGAKVLLTEDMQDGRILDGLRLMNPFVAANAKSIDDLLAG